MRRELLTAILIVLTTWAAPAAADSGEYSCTVIAGTEATGPDGGLYGISATSPGGSVGECHLHETNTQSVVSTIDTTPGCDVHADTDEDAFVETSVAQGDVFSSGTTFVAFCDTGVTMAENVIRLDGTL